jgi:hypothetical protein
MPPPPQFAEAAPGIRAKAIKTPAVDMPSLSFLLFLRKPISFVGLRG